MPLQREEGEDNRETGSLPGGQPQPTPGEPSAACHATELYPQPPTPRIHIGTSIIVVVVQKVVIYIFIAFRHRMDGSCLLMLGSKTG